MSKTYNPREYHNRPLANIELADGTVWRIRQPKVQDLDMMDELRQAQVQRFQDHRDHLLALAEEARAKAEDGNADGDAAAREVLSAQPDEDPDDVSRPYLHAEVLAAFITPEVSPSEVLRRLGEEYDLDFLYERHEELLQALSGDAAKKRMRVR